MSEDFFLKVFTRQDFQVDELPDGGFIITTPGQGSREAGPHETALLYNERRLFAELLKAKEDRQRLLRIERIAGHALDHAARAFGECWPEPAATPKGG